MAIGNRINTIKRWPHHKKWGHRLLLISLILGGFALRLHAGGAKSLWYDELLQLDIVRGPISQILPQLKRHAAMPLDYLLLYGWVRGGQHEAWLRFPAAVWGTLALPLIYQLGRAMFNRAVGYGAIMLLTLSSFAVRYSQEARPYSLLLMLILLSYLAVWRGYQHGRLRDWLLAALSLTGATLTHYFALFAMLPLLMLGLLKPVYQPEQWRNSCLLFLGLMWVAIALLLVGRPQTLYTVGYQFSTVISQPEQLSRPRTEKPNRGPGPPQNRAFFINKVLQPLATDSPQLLVPYLLLLLIAPLSLLTSPAHRAAILLLLGWLILPTMLIYLFLLHRGTFYAIRYILHLLPAFLLLLSFSGWQLSRRLHPLLLPLILLPLLLSNYHEIQRLYQAPSYENWRAVGQLLHANARPTDRIIAPRAAAPLNWYAPPLPRLPENWPDVATMEGALQPPHRYWIILSSYSARHDAVLRAWLRQHNAVLLNIDRRVILYYHQPGRTMPHLLNQVAQFELPPLPRLHRSLARQRAAHGLPAPK